MFKFISCVDIIDNVFFHIDVQHNVSKDAEIKYGVGVRLTEGLYETENTFD